MPNHPSQELDASLREFLELPAEASPAQDLNQALRVAELLESGGYAFSLKDMCPKSMDSLWRASFAIGGKEFAAEDARSALAICTAAVTALKDSSGTA